MSDLRTLTESAWYAGQHVVDWQEKSGRDCDRPKYMTFEEWWEANK
jgi:hypothetical protein